MRLLFVCTGNCCRSPMAEALAKRTAAEMGMNGIEIGSAGIAAVDGQAASLGAQHAMAAIGLSLASHQARRLTSQMVAQSDLILTMTAAHAQTIRRMLPSAQVFTLNEFVGEPGDVADPWGGNDAIYADCARQLERRIALAMARIHREAGER